MPYCHLASGGIKDCSQQQKQKQQRQKQQQQQQQRQQQLDRSTTVPGNNQYPTNHTITKTAQSLWGSGYTGRRKMGLLLLLHQRLRGTIATIATPHDTCLSPTPAKSPVCICLTSSLGPPASSVPTGVRYLGRRQSPASATLYHKHCTSQFRSITSPSTPISMYSQRYNNKCACLSRPGRFS